MAARRLTTEFARRVPFAESGQDTYSDSELRGFYLRVNCASKTWIAQRSLGGRQRRVTLGRFPDLNAAEAREAARKALADLGQGRDPAEERRRVRALGITLRQALELHLAAKPHAERTEADYWDVLERYVEDWLDRPLRELGEDRAGVRARHERVSGKRGRTVADYAFRIVRAAYNRALREHPNLPPNPCANVDFRAPRRRVVKPSPDELVKWGRAVVGIQNPVRRDLHLFMLLTGMRRTAACEVQAKHVKVDDGVLHVPRPKGGAARAFDLPLSAPLLDLVRHRLEENRKVKRGTPWLFPSTTSKSGRLVEVKERALGKLHGHALRHLYSSLALEAGVPIAELKFLLNHRVADVTFTYLQPGLAHLRQHQERASARILEAVGLHWEEGWWPPIATHSANATR